MAWYKKSVCHIVVVQEETGREDEKCRYPVQHGAVYREKTCSHDRSRPERFSVALVKSEPDSGLRLLPVGAQDDARDEEVMDKALPVGKGVEEEEECERETISDRVLLRCGAPPSDGITKEPASQVEGLQQA